MFCFDPTSLLQVDIDPDWAMVGTPFVGPEKGCVFRTIVNTDSSQT